MLTSLFFLFSAFSSHSLYSGSQQKQYQCTDYIKYELIDCSLYMLKVANRFLMAVKECSEPDLNMAFFISYDADDIIKQAQESSLRYQQGTKQF